MRIQLLSATFLVLVLCLLAGAYAGVSTANGEGLSIEPFIWQFDQDGAGPSKDQALPITTVYIKTHDGVDWMSTYDPTGFAVSGPDSLRQLVAMYHAKDIRVVAWFAPTPTDFDRQTDMAIQVLDTGVDALYADVEPFAGFCNQDCQALADNVWVRVRQERPAARLGVIYVPFDPWPVRSGIFTWLASADEALPMCYWETFKDLGIWSDPAGCVRQARLELDVWSQGRPLEFVPILQGDTAPERIQQAMDATTEVGSTRVSLWRRGVITNEAWNSMAAYAGRSGIRCFESLQDGCVVREVATGRTYVLKGGRKFALPYDAPELVGMPRGQIQIVPLAAIDGVPDGVLEGGYVRQSGQATIYAIKNGAAFRVPPFVAQELGLPSVAVEVTAEQMASIPTVPADFSRIQEEGDDRQYFVAGGVRYPLTQARAAALDAAGLTQISVLPAWSLLQVPVANVVAGDADCNGDLELADIVRMASALQKPSSTGVCNWITSDFDCDGTLSQGDVSGALKLLLFESGDRGVAECPEPPPAPTIAPAIQQAKPSPAPTPARETAPVPNATPTRD